MNRIKFIKIIRPILITFILAVLVLPSIPLFHFDVPVRAAPPDAYWVGGSGTWSDAATHWAAATGGAPNAANLPDATSNTHFDDLSDSGGADFTVTINGVDSCNSMDWTGVDVTPTLARSSGGLSVHGSLTLVSTMSIDTGFIITFSSTGAGNTVTTAGLVMPAMVFSGTGGVWTLQDNVTINSSAGGNALTLTSGTLNTNNKSIYLDSLATPGFQITGVSAKILTLGSSTITLINGDWDYSGSNLTLNEGTSIIIINATDNDFLGGGETYYDVRLLGNSHIVSGSNTFATLTRTGTATQTDSVTFSGDQTVTGTLTLNGNSATNRLKVQSDTIGTARTLTAATVSVQYCDFQDITGADAGSWNLTSGITGNLGGNLGITFTPASSLYWVDNDGTYTDVLHWASTSGGVGGTGRVPLAQDTAVFDASSFTVDSRVVTMVTNYILGNIDASLVTHTPVFTAAGMSMPIYGSFNNGTFSWSSTTGTLQFYQRSTTNLTSAGALLPNIDVGSSTGDGINGTLLLQDDLTSIRTLTFYRGILDFNDKDVSVGIFDSATDTYNRTLYMGSGTITLTSTGSVWNMGAATLLTLTRETSTIKILNNTAGAVTFVGASKTYNDFTIAGSGNFATTITGTNTFVNFNVDRSLAAKTITGAVTCSVTNLYIPDSSPAGTIVTINGTDFTKSGGGLVSSDYLNLTNSVANPVTTFYAGTHSTDNGGNTNWIFTAPPAFSNPTITSVAASGVTNFLATMNGSYTLGSYSDAYVYFEYGLTVAYGNTTTEQHVTSGTTFTSNLSGLSANTTYYFRAVMRYNYSTIINGSGLTFTTTGAPLVVTNDATSITTSSAILQGNLTSLGVESYVTVYFEYGTTVAYGTTTPQQAMTSPDSFSITLIGLASGTTYHYRAKGTYGSSTVNGVDKTFTIVASQSIPITTQPYAPLGGTGESSSAGTIPTLQQPTQWWATGASIATLPFYASFDAAATAMNPNNTAAVPHPTTMVLYLMAILATAMAAGYGVLLFTGSSLLALGTMGILAGIGASMTIISVWIIFIIVLGGILIWYLSKFV